MMSKFYIPESLHWYDINGTPVFEVPLKKPAKDGRTHTKPTITHARKMHLFPSVTSILKGTLPTPPPVRDWMVNLAADAVMETVDAHWMEELGYDFKEWKEDALKRFQQKLTEAPDEGTKMHAEIAESFLKGDIDYAPEGSPSRIATHIINDWMVSSGYEHMQFEVPFTNSRLGWAGRSDLILNDEDIMDIKTVNHDAFVRMDRDRRLYPEWLLQLCGYGLGLELHGRYYSAIVDRSDGKTFVHEWTRDEIEDSYNIFRRSFELWVALKNYDPRAWSPSE